ncbi:hypothetical protein D3C76_1058000 [compost metagenome]
MQAFRPQRVDVVGIDQVDDLHVPRQHALHQTHRPGFQGFWQQRVVGVGQRLDGDLPSGFPGNAVLVDQQAHQLGHGNRGVGVIELDGSLVCQVDHRIVHVQMAAEQILQRRRNKEIFLAQAQFLPGLGAVGRVQHP